MLVEKSAVSCDEVNRIQLQLLDWGHACTAREWVGDIRDPAYARLYYICDGDPYIVFAGHQLPLQPGWWHLLPGGFSFRHACRSRMEQLYFHIQLVDDTGVNLLRRTDGFLSRRGDPELARSMAKALQGGDLAACLRLRQQVFGLVLDMLAGSPIPLRPARHSACVREATAYIRSHPTIQLDTLYESSLYKVVAVYAVTARTEDTDYFAFNTYVDFDTDEEEQEYLDEIEQRAFYTTGDYVRADEKLLSLCTCTYQMEDARLVVMARPLREGEDPEAGTVTVNPNPLVPARWP